MGSYRTYHQVWNQAAPVQGPVATGNILVELAVKFTQPGHIAALQYYRQSADQNHHIGYIIHQVGSAGALVEATVRFRRQQPALGETASVGWNRAYLRRWLRVVPGDIYGLVVWFGNGQYSNMVAAHSPDADIVVGPITVPGTVAGVITNGVTGTALNFLPGTAIGNAKPAIDIMFHKDGDP